MNKYRHLGDKDKKKLKFYKKSGKALFKSFKWWAAVTGVLIVFAVGIFAFYKFVDKNSSKENESEIISANKQVSEDDTAYLDQASRNELERESKKAESITPKAQENEESIGEDKNEGFYDFSKWNQKCPKTMVVVNKDNLVPEGLSVQTKNCRGKEVAVECFDDLDKMISDAKKEGIKLWISSGYRDVNLQTKLFNRQVEREKSKAVISEAEAERRAAKVVARPKTSEHNTGLAIDFNGVEDNFYQTKEYKWLIDNAHKYGFIERYQKKWKDKTGVIYEPWHFRYVGKEYAGKIKDSGLCLESYVANNLI